MPYKACSRTCYTTCVSTSRYLTRIPRSGGEEQSRLSADIATGERVCVCVNFPPLPLPAAQGQQPLITALPQRHQALTAQRASGLRNCVEPPRLMLQLHRRRTAVSARQRTLHRQYPNPTRHRGPHSCVEPPRLNAAVKRVTKGAGRCRSTNSEDTASPIAALRGAAPCSANGAQHACAEAPTGGSHMQRGKGARRGHSST